MNYEQLLKSTSKFLSLVLRHRPELIGLRLDEKGWASTAELLEKLEASGKAITNELLAEMVATNAKQRFAFNEDKSMIRASQGHSIHVDLELAPVEPPVQLYHGTAEQNLASILAHGLEKRGRQHVHLSAGISTALQVGQRHGKPVVLVVDALQMHEQGFAFFLSENNVWLTDHVPAEYLRRQ
ncbi:RNA 2'-phosphotransferase [Aridibaculum aurantiacum]|uniref:RNA 2'-phosphotransferase n=1 Tax=Aridibaculum aurantiacum TaxID=2810307 RepID=UPI001A95AF54|nr:RNA 2'-phosphotransferase [Aridibaculum aurantiacum]